MMHSPTDISATRLERLLQVHVAVLGIMGTMLLGMGQMYRERPFYVLPLLVLVTACLSLWVTDWKRWFQLNGLLANLAALIAAAISVSDFLRLQTESQLLAIANLLVYLQIILFFQEKSSRIYWQLLMLSLLQVVVAAALNLGVEFGLLLLVYMLLMVSALVLLFVHRETARFSGRQAVASSRLSELEGMCAGKTSPKRRQKSWSVLVGQTVGDLPNRMFGRSLPRHVAMICGVTLLLATLVFFLVPRHQRIAWQGIVPPRVESVGYSEEVTLGELGSVIQDPQLVMQVRFSDRETGEPYPITSSATSLLFRGGVLTDYDCEKNKWSRMRPPRRGESWHQPSQGLEVVRQEIKMESYSHSVMFGIYPPVCEETEHRIALDTNRNELYCKDDYRRRRHDDAPYVLDTTGLVNGYQDPITASTVADRATIGNINSIAVLTTEQRNQMPEMCRIAETVISDLNSQQTTVKERAEALRDYFLESGKYSYTLDPHTTPDGIDPIDYFVAERRRGHCEYYAAALTLMLRSQDIPARMVIGFAGGDWNSYAKVYQIRQLHAHTWVEVYLSHDQLPDEYEDRVDMASGGWLTLDATPEEERIRAAARTAGWFAGTRELLEYAQIMWRRHVVNLSAERQDETIYEPLREAADQIAGLWQAGQSEGANVSSWHAKFADTWEACWSYLLSWRGLPAVVLFLVLVRIVWRWIRPRWKRRTRRRADKKQGRQLPPTIDFYDRLEVILAKEGLRRENHQTQRELAACAGGQLADSPALRGVSRLPRRIVDAFYRVRFGGRALDNSEAQAVEQALVDLKSALRAARRPR
jgi:hypothetical protein